MKRAEFLKRLGLGAVAAVAAPALLAKEEKPEERYKVSPDVKDDELAFWRQRPDAPVATASYTYEAPTWKSFNEAFKNQQSIKFKGEFLYED